MIKKSIFILCTVLLLAGLAAAVFVKSRGKRPNIFEFQLPDRVLKAEDYIDSVALAKKAKLGVEKELNH